MTHDLYRPCVKWEGDNLIFSEPPKAGQVMPVANLFVQCDLTMTAVRQYLATFRFRLVELDDDGTDTLFFIADW